MPDMRDFLFTPEEPWTANFIKRIAEDYVFDPMPDEWQICDLLNTTYLASLQTEEGHLVRMSLLLISPDSSHLNDLFRHQVCLLFDSYNRMGICLLSLSY